MTAPLNTASLVSGIVSDIERMADGERQFWAEKLTPLLAALESTSRALSEKEALARRLSEALIKVRPLGGSELFTRVGEEFYADPTYCGGEIDKLRSELHSAKTENIRLKQEKFATTRQRDEALAALKASEERGERLSSELASARLRPEPGAVEFVQPGAKKSGDRISLPGGWYFERYNDDGVVFNLRSPNGHGFGIKGTGCGLYTETAQAFAKAMWQAGEVRS